MGGINVNKPVFDTIKSVSSGYVYGRDEISDANVNKIEAKMAEDGLIDDGESQVLNALKNKTSFTVTSGGETLNVSKDLMAFTPSEVDFFPKNTRVAKYSDDVIRRVPANVPYQQAGSGYKTDVAVNGNGDWNKAKTAFLDINNWEKTSDSRMSAAFQLTDASGKPKTGAAQVGDLIRIDIPGPGINGKDGYDWVKIEAIRDTPSEVQIQVRPTDMDGDGSADHFFTAKATNTFTLTKGGENQIQFKVNGRNEVSNGSFATPAQNWLANSSGGQEGQWENLGAGIIKAAK